MAEYYKIELSQKIPLGMTLNAERCLAIGGNAALDCAADENRHFIINEDKAGIVKGIFEMHLASATMAKTIPHCILRFGTRAWLFVVLFIAGYSVPIDGYSTAAGGRKLSFIVR